VLVHRRYDPRIPGARDRARHRARRLQAAIEARYAALAASGGLEVQAVVRAGDAAALEAAQDPAVGERQQPESHP
jgi:hypothetical protein